MKFLVVSSQGSCTLELKNARNKQLLQTSTGHISAVRYANSGSLIQSSKDDNRDVNR